MDTKKRTKKNCRIVIAHKAEKHLCGTKLTSGGAASMGEGILIDVIAARQKSRRTGSLAGSEVGNPHKLRSIVSWCHKLVAQVFHDDHH